MTVARRLGALGQALPAKEATLLWMRDALAYESLPEYARSIIDEPDDVAPFISVSRQAQPAAREATAISARGHRASRRPDDPGGASSRWSCR